MKINYYPDQRSTVPPTKEEKKPNVGWKKNQMFAFYVSNPVFISIISRNYRGRSHPQRRKKNQMLGGKKNQMFAFYVSNPVFISIISRNYRGRSQCNAYALNKRQVI